MYEIGYLDGLVPDVTPEALEVGRKYHQYVEMAIKGLPIPHDLSREEAMAVTFRDRVLPVLPPDMETEKWLSGTLLSWELTGRMDAYSESEHAVIEHKTTSLNLDGEYAESLMHDEQALMYCLLSGTRKYVRDAIRKPTIRRKSKETEAEFFARMLEWYAEDPDEKVRVFRVEFSPADICSFSDSLGSLIGEVENIGYFWRNRAHCSCFGSKCAYAPLCHEKISRDSAYAGFHWKEERNGINKFA
jgi:hypothetical protein